MSIAALGKRVVIIPIEDAKRRASGLIVPEEAKQRIDQGIVRARGRDTIDVRVGDHVLFSGYSGTKITTEADGEVIVLDESDIKAVIDDSPPLRLYSEPTILKLIEDAYNTTCVRNQNQYLADPLETLYDSIRAMITSYTYYHGFEF